MSRKSGPKPPVKQMDISKCVFREVEAMKTIKPTSVEAERAFSAMGFFATKLRNRMGDKTLDGLITLRQSHKKPKTTDSDSDDE